MGRVSDLARRRAGPTLLAAGLAALAPWSAAADGAPPPAAPDTWYTRSAVAALRAADETPDLQTAGLAALNSVIADTLAGLSTLAPDRAGRSQLQLHLSETWQPGYDALTVQPLYRSSSGQDTVIVEGRLARAAGADRTTGNAGMGYRRLVHGGRILLGASSFYDHEWPYDERRLGVGAEVRSRPLQLNAIYYGTVPSDEAAAGTESGAGAEEEVLNGFNLELGAQIPYLPWARVYGETFREELNALGDVTGGERFGLRLSPLPSVEVELGGASSDSAIEPTYYGRLRVTRVFGGPPPKRQPLIDREPFAFDDVRTLSLDRLPR